MQEKPANRGNQKLKHILKRHL